VIRASRGPSGSVLLERPNRADVCFLGIGGLALEVSRRVRRRAFGVSARVRLSVGSK
jgi:hypothetical protein